ncbi:MAG TPA: SDR family oxidoreductase [Mycobacterium sp.]|nr:SDR family oxidoreductase [Mycobacterium sp.]
MTDPEEFTGRTALITGGTRGIGKGIAERLRAGGARVLVAARSVPEGQSADDVVVADVTSSDGVAAMAAEALERLGDVDILVHNVGGSSQHDGGVTSLTDDDWQSAVDQNLFAAVRLDRAIVPQMVRRGSGAIVHVTSIQRRAPLLSTIPYAAAKAALTNYSKALSDELARNGIRVNAVCPGFIETESASAMVAQIAEIEGLSHDQARAKIVESIGGIPLGAPGSPADVGELVAFLVSDRAAYITGAEYVIDGGSLRSV